MRINEETNKQLNDRQFRYATQINEFYIKNNRFPYATSDDTKERLLFSKKYSLRQYYSKGRLTEETVNKIKKLNIGLYNYMIKTGSPWDNNIKDLKKWLDKHDEMPIVREDNAEETRLSYFIKNTRNKWNRGELTQKQIDQLNEITPVLLQSGPTSVVYRKQVISGIDKEKLTQPDLKYLISIGVKDMNNLLDAINKADDNTLDKIFNIINKDKVTIRNVVNNLYKEDIDYLYIDIIQSIFDRNILRVYRSRDIKWEGIFDRLKIQLGNIPEHRVKVFLTSKYINKNKRVLGDIFKVSMSRIGEINRCVINELTLMKPYIALGNLEIQYLNEELRDIVDEKNIVKCLGDSSKTNEVISLESIDILKISKRIKKTLYKLNIDTIDKMVTAFGRQSISGCNQIGTRMKNQIETVCIKLLYNTSKPYTIDIIIKEGETKEYNEHQLELINYINNLLEEIKTIGV